MNIFKSVVKTIIPEKRVTNAIELIIIINKFKIDFIDL